MGLIPSELLDKLDATSENIDIMVEQLDKVISLLEQMLDRLPPIE